MRSLVTLAVLAQLVLVSACGGSGAERPDEQTFTRDDLEAIVAPDPALEAPGIIAASSRSTTIAPGGSGEAAGTDLAEYAAELEQARFQGGARTVWSGQHVAKAEALLFPDAAGARAVLRETESRIREALGRGVRVDELPGGGLGEESWGVTGRLRDAAGPALAIYAWQRANLVLAAQVDCGLGRECEIDVTRAARAYAQAIDARARESED